RARRHVVVTGRRSRAVAEPGPARAVRSVSRVVDQPAPRGSVAVDLGAVPDHGVRARRRLSARVRARGCGAHLGRALPRDRRYEPPRAVHARGRRGRGAGRLLQSELTGIPARTRVAVGDLTGPRTLVEQYS